MGGIASQITSLMIVYSTVYSDADQRKDKSSTSLTFVWGIHRGRVNSPHKWPVKQKMLSFDDVIMDQIAHENIMYIGWFDVWLLRVSKAYCYGFQALGLVEVFRQRITS